ncbi:hypothetical protein E6H12_00350 [Candidatus Bathyarchaeota archaeon]|nr:MAG: hypothetical protein E6H12_00350 [Candidatus Bathyarchaeota archaeon]
MTRRRDNEAIDPRECVSSLSLPSRLGINRCACSHEVLKYSLGRNELQDNTLQTFGLSVKSNGDYHAISASSAGNRLIINGNSQKRVINFRCGSLTRRRDTTRVIQDILNLGNDGFSRTQAIYKANLSFSLAKRYIPFLVSKGHLEQGTDNRGVQTYVLTTKGQHLLLCIAEIQRELDGLFITR